MEKRFQRIVVKVGSNVLTRRDGTLDVTHMSALVDQLAELHRAGVEVILVSSGAVASGRGEVHPSGELDEVSQRQLFSAVGQAKLMNRYYDLFRCYGIVVGQVLTTKESIATPRHYANQRHCIEVMLQTGVLPIVNENDTVSITELMFTDNDELSGLMATMTGAEALFLLSNVDGVYDGPPSSPASRLIRRVEVGKDLTDYVQPERSGFGRGGMASKSSVARQVADQGLTVFIANGRREGVILALCEHPEDTPCTQFIPKIT
jgi:glutamate 5-kinase